MWYETITDIFLCVYAQQGYAFGRIGLCIDMYVNKQQAV